MELRSEYKQTDVGVIPGDWRVEDYISLGGIIDGDRGVNYPGSTDFQDDGYCLFLNASNVTKTGFQFSDCQFITADLDGKMNKGKLKRGDIILTTRGTVGNLAYYDKTIPFENIRINSGMVILRNYSELVSNDYLYFVLRSHIVETQLSYLSFGSAQPQLTVKGISTLIIPIPPSPAEQKAIADALSDADALIESLEQLIAKKRQIKQGVMQELLTGKKRLPGYSGEWIEKSLGELFYFSGGLSASRDQLSSEGFCYLHYGDIHLSQKTYIDVQFEYQAIPKLKIDLKKVSQSSLLRDGDVVFVDASEDDEGTSKHVVTINKNNISFISGLHTIVAKSKSNELDHNFRQFCFQTEEIKKQFYYYAVGTKVSGISKNNIGKIILRFPTVKEQASIAEILRDIDDEINALEVKLDKTRKIKQGMMHELLTGRIRLI